MSTRSSIYYSARVHIYHDYADGRHYIEFGEDGRERQIPEWLAYALCGRFGAIRWPLVSRVRYERDLKTQLDATLRAETKAALAERKAEGRDCRPYQERQDGMVSVPASALKIAWSIAKDRRDAAFSNRLEQAQEDLDALKAAGFGDWVPTLAEVREAWNRE